MIFDKASPDLFPDLNVSIHASRDELGREAAEKSAEIIRAAIRDHGRARILVATGNSQLQLVEHLTEMSLDWSRVDAFHLDEYVGIAADHPASFRHWIRTRFEEKVRPGSMHYLRGDAPDPDQEALRYSALLLAQPVDLAFVGFGENGHIAFNEPGSSLASRTRIKTLTDQTRRDNARFFGGDVEAVPRHCLTQGLGTIMAARHVVLVATGTGKAEAVHQLVEGPVSALWPATILQHHPHATVLLDDAAASRLQLAGYYRQVFAGKPAWQGL